MSGFKERMAAMNRTSASEDIKNVAENREYSESGFMNEPTPTSESVSEPQRKDFNVKGINISNADDKSAKNDNKSDVTNSNDEKVVTAEKKSVQKNPSEKNAVQVNRAVPLKEQNIIIDPAGYKAITLLHDFDRYVRMRGKQLGVSRNIYLNVLLWEEKERIKNENSEERYMALFESCYKKYKDTKERCTVGFTSDNLEFLAAETSNAGISFTDYINHIVEAEMEREKMDGKRI